MKRYHIIIVWLLSWSIIGAYSSSYVPPTIKGVKGAVEGKTDNPKVVCVLRYNAKGLHKEASFVEGNLVIQSDYITSGVSLTIYKPEGFELISAVNLKGGENGNQTKYYFSLNKDLIKSSKLTIFTADGMRRLDLSSLTIQPPLKK